MITENIDETVLVEAIGTGEAEIVYLYNSCGLAASAGGVCPGTWGCP